MRISDWSSDVCSSDLLVGGPSQLAADHRLAAGRFPGRLHPSFQMSRPPAGWCPRFAGLCALLGLGVSGCATYAHLPLGDGQGASGVMQLQAPTAAMPVPLAVTHRFDPSDGLDVTEVAMLAEIGRAHVCTPVTNATIVFR